MQPGVLYLAGNRVFRLTDKAEHYKVISPDLTRNEPGKIDAAGSGAENYGVVYSLAESPVKAGLLWAGTDDGRLWVTQNDGDNWTELTAKLPEPERGQWIVRIEPGAKDAKVAYVVTNAYRSGDDRPFILRTADMGQTWQSVVGQGITAQRSGRGRARGPGQFQSSLCRNAFWLVRFRRPRRTVGADR